MTRPGLAVTTLQRGIVSQLPVPPIIQANNGHIYIPMIDSIRHILAHDVPVEPLLRPNRRGFKQSHSNTPRGLEIMALGDKCTLDNNPSMGPSF